MKAIILAGGLGTRLSEETDTKPKPMVEICGKPILWHIMNSFALQGFNEFLVAVGYKGDVIEDWVKSSECPWNVVALKTGLNSQTGGRIRQALDYLDEKIVFATYGDGLANVRLNELLMHHKKQNVIATVTAVRPPARFGYLDFNNDIVTRFGEKDQTDEGWINGGFFVLNQEVTNYIQNDLEPFETGALPRIVDEMKLAGYKHYGFWKPMDTLREKLDLERMYGDGKNPPWLAL